MMKKMTSRTCDCSRAELGNFLADYSAWLWGCGATCVRIEKNVGRIARAFGHEVLVTLMPKHISITLTDTAGPESQIFCKPMAPCGINFDINAELSALSWNISDNALSLQEAKKVFGRITSKHYTNGFHILLFTSLANAAFCRLFGGDAKAMAIVFAATAAGYFVKQLLMRRKMDIRVVFFICAFVSSALCAGAANMGWSNTPDIALATSVLYLIPGVPYLNSASDLIDKHYLCAMSRFLDAIVLTATLSLGMCLGLFLMNASIL